ncbi:MAG: NUDIX domain-containing protein [Chloroflexota bacterium]
MSEAERTRVAAYALCVDEARKILLCRMAPSIIPGDVWTLPGGGIHFGESPETAVIRELDEETGQGGEIVRLVEVNDRLLKLESRPGTVHAIRIVYEVRVTGGQLREEAAGTTDACSWFTFEEAGRVNLNDLARRAIELLAAEPS